MDEQQINVKYHWLVYRPAMPYILGRAFSQTTPSMNGFMKQLVSNDHRSMDSDFNGAFCEMPP